MGDCWYFLNDLIYIILFMAMPSARALRLYACRPYAQAGIHFNPYRELTINR